ncbi:MAG: DUF6220 domain-containing protein [Cyanobacteria bacterium P01_C01_bin.118]
MHSTSLSESIDAVPMVIKKIHKPRFRIVGFYILAVLFNLCLSGQLLTVGLAYFTNSDWWQAHIWWVRSYSGLSLVLLVWVYSLSFPRRIRILTLSMPVLLGLQFFTIHWHPSFLPWPLAIVHPLLGFLLLSVSSTLVHRTWQLIGPQKATEI